MKNNKETLIIWGIVTIFLILVILFIVFDVGASQLNNEPYPALNNSEPYPIAEFRISDYSNRFMPLIFKDGVYYDTPTPTPTLTPTATKTPKPPTPTPTATPTYILAEGGNSCAYIIAAGRSADGGTGMGALVPSVCSYLVPYQVQQDGTLLIVKAERIKTDTYGCQEDDFGPLVKWPPIDYDCPPPSLDIDDLIDPNTGMILWGDLDLLVVPNSYQIVCGYCEECDDPHTVNCVEVVKPEAFDVSMFDEIKR